MRRFFLFLLILSGSLLKSQIFLTNKTNEPVSVAVAIYYDDKNFKGWISSGWTYIIPNETKPLNKGGSGTTDIFYYYAVSKSGKVYQGNDGSMTMLVTEKPFSIKNCNMGYALDQNPGSSFKIFRKVKMNAKRIQTKYTFELQY